MAQQLYGLVQGYEDLNDHDELRSKKMFGVALGKLDSRHARCAPLSGESTLNRLE
jgi:Transposase DDE domain group 1